MRRFLAKITLVDFMVLIAILMILSAMVLPHFAESRHKTRTAQPAHQTAPVRPAR